MNPDSPKPGEIFTPQKSRPDLLTRVFFNSQELRAGWRLILYLLVVVILAVLLGQVVTQLWKSFSPGLTPGYVFVGDLVGIGAVFGGALVMSFIESRAPGVYGLPLRFAPLRRFLQGVLWGLAEAAVLVALISAWGGYSFGGFVVQGGAVVRWGVLWAVVFLAVGLFEEFGYRGYLQFTLSSGIGFWPAAVLLSAIFGGRHLSNPGEGWVGASGAGLIGLFYCLTLRRTGSLWFAVGAHAAFDWGETFLFSVPNSGLVANQGHLSNATLHGPAWLTGGTVGPEGSVFCFLTTGLMSVVFSWVYPAKRLEGQPAPASDATAH